MGIHAATLDAKGLAMAGRGNAAANTMLTKYIRDHIIAGMRVLKTVKHNGKSTAGKTVTRKRNPIVFRKDSDKRKIISAINKEVKTTGKTFREVVPKFKIAEYQFYTWRKALAQKSQKSRAEKKKSKAEPAVEAA